MYGIAKDTSTLFVLKSGETIMSNQSFKVWLAVFKKLPKKSFIQIARGTIINLECMHKIYPEGKNMYIVLRASEHGDESALQVYPTYRATFMKHLGTYFLSPSSEYMLS
jgi:DNA-binding LytR/AlgR family response regulator